MKLLEASTGDFGWNIFSLDYIVDAPISTILTKPIMEKYLRIFNHLFRVKRIDHILHSLWSSNMENKQALFRFPDIRAEVHKCDMLRNEMIHFVSNVHNYIMVEVLEAQWKVF